MSERLIERADHYLAEYQSKIERATTALTDEQFWWRPDPRTNSIGNLLLHLRGNLSQWVLDGVLGESYERHRTREFGTRAGSPGGELVGELGATVARCRAGLAELDPTTLQRQRRIQGYDTDGYGALFHAVEHMSYHTGQIVHLAKSLLPGDTVIEFYPQHRGE